MSTNQSLNEPGGDFLCFEPVTLVPFDREGIQPELLREDEITWLNAYHERVWNKISPYLNDAERDWLYEATRPF